MKINTSSFPIENSVIAADDEELYYDTPNTKIQDDWDALALHYAKKAEELNAEDLNENEFYRNVGLCLGENDAAIQTFNLIDSNVLKPVEITSGMEQEKANLTEFALNECLNILRGAKKELQNAIEEEIEVYKELSSVNYPVKFYNNDLRVYFNDSFIQYGNPDNEKYIPTGLTLCLTYKDYTFNGFYKGNSTKNLDKFNEYFIEERIKGDYNFQNVKLEIKQEVTAFDDELCISLLKEFRKGKKLAIVESDIIIALSRKFLQMELNSYKNIEFVNGSLERLKDDCSPTFYVIADKTVFKVVREKDDFYIFKNGIPIKYSRNEKFVLN